MCNIKTETAALSCVFKNITLLCLVCVRGRCAGQVLCGQRHTGSWWHHDQTDAAQTGTAERSQLAAGWWQQYHFSFHMRVDHTFVLCWSVFCSLLQPFQLLCWKIPWRWGNLVPDWLVEVQPPDQLSRVRTGRRYQIRKQTVGQMLPNEISQVKKIAN